MDSSASSCILITYQNAFAHGHVCTAPTPLVAHHFGAHTLEKESGEDMKTWRSLTHCGWEMHRNDSHGISVFKWVCVWVNEGGVVTW